MNDDRASRASTPMPEHAADGTVFGRTSETTESAGDAARDAAGDGPVGPAAPETTPDLHHSDLYINREISWLAFNERVLEEAENPRTPLLERLKFLAIFSMNLDEFIMIRYAGLKDGAEATPLKRSPDGLTPREQLERVRMRLHPLVRRHRRVLGNDVLPALEGQGVRLVGVDALDDAERRAVDAFFEEELFPVLTPLAVDSGHPFPRLPNLSFSLLLELYEPERGRQRIALVQVPSVLPRFFPLPGESGRYLILEEIIRAKLDALFPGHVVRESYAFRLTRNADFEIGDAEPDDLMNVVQDEVRRRRWGDAVRLEVTARMPLERREYLRRAHDLEPDDVYEIPNHLSVADFMELATLPRPELRYEPFTPTLPKAFRGNADPFEAVRAGDVLVHHPFESFDAVQTLLDCAAVDPNVLAIKQTLYRSGRRSPVVAALARAAGNGKLVTALVELKARFDEENNIGWARELERAGVHVVYGFADLKTHCKALLVVRREEDGIRRYVHLATGNYNAVTSTLYTDMGLFTCAPEFGADVSELFNALTGFSKQREWRRLWIAPDTLRERVIGAIEREAAHARAGRPARIVAKMNALVDPSVIRALYAASGAGVDIDLVIRGVCCLRPGLRGVSDRIRVTSVVGRFLEHSRAYWFHDDGAERVWLASADWMQRNFDRRVETVFPVEDPRLKQRLIDTLELYLADNDAARELQPDGVYRPVRRRPGQRRVNAQERLLQRAERNET